MQRGRSSSDEREKEGERGDEEWRKLSPHPPLSKILQLVLFWRARVEFEGVYMHVHCRGAIYKWPRVVREDVIRVCIRRGLLCKRTSFFFLCLLNIFQKDWFRPS